MRGSRGIFEEGFAYVVHSAESFFEELGGVELQRPWFDNELESLLHSGVGGDQLVHHLLLDQSDELILVLRSIKN